MKINLAEKISCLFFKPQSVFNEIVHFIKTTSDSNEIIHHIEWKTNKNQSLIKNLINFSINKKPLWFHLLNLKNKDVFIHFSGFINDTNENYTLFLSCENSLNIKNNFFSFNSLKERLSKAMNTLHISNADFLIKNNLLEDFSQIYESWISLNASKLEDLTLQNSSELFFKDFNFETFNFLSKFYSSNNDIFKKEKELFYFFEKYIHIISYMNKGHPDNLFLIDGKLREILQKSIYKNFNAIFHFNREPDYNTDLTSFALEFLTTNYYTSLEDKKEFLDVLIDNNKELLFLGIFNNYFTKDELTSLIENDKIKFALLNSVVPQSTKKKEIKI